MTAASDTSWKQATAAAKAVVGDRHVSTQARDLAEFGARDEDAPAWLLRPGSAAEVSELVRLAGQHKVAVVPVGNATRATGRPEPAQACFFVDLRRMHHVLHLDETSLVVHVQAGLSAHALESILAPRGLSLGDYPPAALNSTIGGLLAVRTPGKSSRRHGFIEDAVLGVSAVLADGRSIHTRVSPAGATGPDLARALCGSEGTLGIITSAVLRTHRRAESRLLTAFALPSFEDALRAINLALREEAAPAAIRVCEATETRGWPGSSACADNEAVLVVATAGPTDLAACDRDLVASAVTASGGRPLEESVANAWWKERAGHSADSSPSRDAAPSLQVSATPSKQLDVYRGVRAAALEAGHHVRAYASRFDIDGGLLFFTFLDDRGEPLSPDQAAEQVATAEAAARTAGAFLLGQTNPALRPYFKQLRATLDPAGILNPGALRD